MTLLEILLALLALFGHAAIWVGAYNRLHAQPFSKRTIKRAEKLIYAALLAGPAAGLWAAWRGFSFWSPDSFLAWSLWCYAWVCWGIALGPGALWLCRRSTANPAAVLLANHSHFRDIAAELNRPLLYGAGRVLGRIPGNQVLTLEINEKTLFLPGLPAELEGISIVHLTDLHYTGQIGREYFERVVEEANRLDADLVAVTGDLVDKAPFMEWIPATLGRLRAPGGVYCVLGNHDKLLPDVDALRRTVEASGIVLLGGRWIETTLRGARVLLAGDERPWFQPGPDLREAPPPESAFRILLAHTPDGVFWARQEHFPLVLAGHNHGGQIRFPWLGPIITPSRYGVKYASGVFQETGTVMHVSRGVSGEHPLRFNCPPELTRLVLTGAHRPN